VKVKVERKTVFGTAWYQLNHSTIRTNVKRTHACTCLVFVVIGS
jgi:hypothetical protein